MKRLFFILFLVLFAAGVNAIMAVVCASLPLAMHPDAGRTATLRKQYWKRLDASGNSLPDSLRITQLKRLEFRPQTESTAATRPKKTQTDDKKKRGRNESNVLS